jgi:hypothetical protein
MLVEVIDKDDLDAEPRDVWLATKAKPIYSESGFSNFLEEVKVHYNNNRMSYVFNVGAIK